MKVAIVHYWLVQMRGGEMVLEALCRLFPNADIYTHVYDRDAVSPLANRKRWSRYWPLLIARSRRTCAARLD